MEDPADGVVHKLGFGVCLVATLVGKDPNTCGDETSPKGIERPERELCGPIEDRVWELDDFRMDAGIEESGDLINSSQGGEIRDAGGGYMRWFSRAAEEKKKRRAHVERGSPSVSLETVSPGTKGIRGARRRTKRTRRRTGLRSEDLLL